MSRRAAKTGAIFAVLSWLSLTVAWADDDAERVFKWVSPSVVTLQTFDEQGRPEGQGSGVVVGTDRIATNCHVVREANGIKVVSGEKEYDASWTLADPTRDLCIVSVTGLAARALPVKKLGELKVGEPVFAVGNPLGFRLSVSSGLVSMIAPMRGEQVIVFSAPLSPGSSGGGLFDGEGRLLGITSAILGSGQNLNLALPAEWIVELAERGVAPPPPVSPPGPEPNWSEEAQALQISGDWVRLEQYARDWHAGQPTSSSAAVYLGVALSMQGRPKEAEATFREALKLDERNEMAWLHLASLLYEQGSKKEAEKALRRAKEILPSHGAIHRLHSNWLLLENRLEQAKAEAREAIRLEPGVHNHWRQLGLVEDRLGHPEESAKAYRAALRLDPMSEELKQALAQALARGGKPEEAHKALDSNSGTGVAAGETWIALGNGELERKRYSSAESAFRKAAELAPELPGAWNGLGVVMAKTGRPAEAEKAYSRGLEIKSLAPGIRAELLTNRSSMRSSLGNTTGALEDVQRAVEIDPNYANGWRILAFLKQEGRDYREAITALRKVVALGAAGADDWVSLAQCLERTGDAQSAQEALQTAEKLDSKNIRVQQELAGFHGRKGDLQRALDYLERALEIDPSIAESWSGKGYALLKMGRLQEAVSVLETATSLDPQLANAWINLGEAQLRSKNLGKAIQALEKAVTLAPAATDARLFLAQAYLGSRQASKAREQAEALLQRYPDLPQALSVATLAYLAEGKADAASGSYQRLRAGNPAAARTLRAAAVSQGLPGARSLPE